MAEHVRYRIYESALTNVRYVFGHPVRFSRKPEEIERRCKAKEAAIEAEQKRAEAAAEREARHG